MLRKLKKCFFAPRRLKSSQLLVIITVIWVALLTISFRTSSLISEILRPPLGLLEKDLGHFRRSRSLRHYLDNIDVLVEPSSLPCGEAQQPSILILVVTAPGRVEYRDAIRRTWGTHFPTYFVMGLKGTRDDGQLIDNYVEAKQNRDMVIFDFKDHYQNLTLKTGLMMQWTLDRCPQAKFLYKVDDDVLVNPWMLRQVVKENGDAKLIGYVNRNHVAHRDEANKWYLPRWLCPDDVIPQYLSGPGYLIKGELLGDILKAAYRVPLHNLEDVYFTYHVANQTLGYQLTHDERMCPFRIQPAWFPFSHMFPTCAYWIKASMHSFRPEEILRYYLYIRSLGEQYDVPERDSDSICTFYRTFVKPFVLMLHLKMMTQTGLSSLRVMLSALRRLKSRKLILIVVIILAALLIIYFRTSPLVSETLRPPLGLIEKDLSHFRRSRSLRHYLDNIDVLVEPSSLPCGEAQQPSILALVATAPGHVERRDAIRRTWGQQFPTYFVVGLNGTRDDGHLKDYYEGEKQYRDMVIFDFKDHYQNLTLKTGLMIRWTLDRCPQTKFLYKVDDDVLINPWILRQVVKENSDAKLIGYVNHNRLAHRDETNKWYLPRWLCPNDFIPQHLSGPGYLIKGELLRDILKAAYGVPLHNLEDVYFTCHVAHQTLGYKLTHDERMCLKRREPFCCPFSYLFPACAYWISASMHGFRPEEILRYYPYIRSLGEQYGVQEQRDIDSICTFYRTFIKPFLVMLCYCH